MDSINVKNICSLNSLYYFQDMSQNAFPFPILLEVKRSVEIFSGNLCFQDGYLEQSMEQLSLVDCITRS